MPLRHVYYRPTGEGETRNDTLCIAGVRDVRLIHLAEGVDLRVSGGLATDPELVVEVEFLIFEGHRVQLGASEFVVELDGVTDAHRVTPTHIATACYANLLPSSCRPELAWTEVLEGQTFPGSGLFASDEPRVFSIALPVASLAVDGFTVTLPPLLVDAVAITPEQVSFQRESLTTVQGFCQ
jgi:hypothetical protein